MDGDRRATKCVGSAKNLLVVGARAFARGEIEGKSERMDFHVLCSRLMTQT